MDTGKRYFNSGCGWNHPAGDHQKNHYRNRPRFRVQGWRTVGGSWGIKWSWWSVLYWNCSWCCSSGKHYIQGKKVLIYFHIWYSHIIVGLILDNKDFKKNSWNNNVLHVYRIEYKLGEEVVSKKLGSTLVGIQRGIIEDKRGWVMEIEEQTSWCKGFCLLLIWQIVLCGMHGHIIFNFLFFF